MTTETKTMSPAQKQFIEEHTVDTNQILKKMLIFAGIKVAIAVATSIIVHIVDRKLNGK